MKTILFLFLILSGCSSGSNSELYQKVFLPDVELHYSVAGEGFPLILIHGSLTDLRYWENQLPELQKQYRVFSYSRRYNYPNQNQNAAITNHSAMVEAEDLLYFMNALKISEAHILGHSYGAYTALIFSLEHPERVKKLIVAEPPILRWLVNTAETENKYETFLHKTWNPMGQAYLYGGENAGLEKTSQWYFGTSFDSIPEFWQNSFTQNSKEWESLTTSEDAFPMVEFEKISGLTLPTMLLSGALSSGNMNDKIDCKLEELLPNNIWIKIENAGHEMFLDNPTDTNRAILNFLANK